MSLLIDVGIYVESQELWNHFFYNPKPSTRLADADRGQWYLGSIWGSAAASGATWCKQREPTSLPAAAAPHVLVLLDLLAAGRTFSSWLHWAAACAWPWQGAPSQVSSSARLTLLPRWVLGSVGFQQQSLVSADRVERKQSFWTQWAALLHAARVGLKGMPC